MFSQETLTLSVKDIYVRNGLLGKLVDKDALIQTLKKTCFYEEEPILKEVHHSDEF